MIAVIKFNRNEYESVQVKCVPFILIRAAPNEYFDTSPYCLTTRN